MTRRLGNVPAVTSNIGKSRRPVCPAAFQQMVRKISSWRNLKSFHPPAVEERSSSNPSHSFLSFCCFLNRTFGWQRRFRSCSYRQWRHYCDVYGEERLFRDPRRSQRWVRVRFDGQRFAFNLVSGATITTTAAIPTKPGVQLQPIWLYMPRIRKLLRCH